MTEELEPQEANDVDTADSEYKSGVMGQMRSMKVILIALVIAGMSMTGLAFLPGVFGGQPVPDPQGVEDTELAPTPVGEDEVVYSAWGKSYTRKQVEEMMKPLVTSKIIEALADPASADKDTRQNLAASLSSVISADVIGRKVESEGVSFSDEEVKVRLEEFIDDNFPDKESYEQARDFYGLTEQGMLQQMRFPLEAEALTDKLLPVNEEEVQEQIEPTYEFKYGSGKLVSHILVADNKTADEVMEKLGDGQTFADLAKEYSLDTTSAQDGGLLGPWSEGLYNESYDNAIKGTDVGKYAGPLESEYGWSILKVDEAPPLDTVRDVIEKQVRQGLQAENWVALGAQLEGDADLTIDPRYGTWKQMAYGGLTPPGELNLTPVETVPEDLPPVESTDGK